jgi:glycosyltransferase involved in cell wall biosynthesis
MQTITEVQLRDSVKQTGQPRICVVATSGLTVRAALFDHIARLSQDYAVDLVVGECSPHLLGGLPPTVRVIRLPLPRTVSLAKDALCAIRLWRLLRAGRYHAIHSITPKGGLLAALAGSVARVPVRMHTFTGQVWATRTGAARLVLKLADRLIAALSTTVLVDGPAQKAFLLRQGVLRPGQGIVLADGSVSGVDLDRFRPDPWARLQVRAELNIPEDSPLILFVGRLSPDKGVLDLARAFAMIGPANAPHLVMVGPDEASLRPRMMALCAGLEDRVRFVDFTDRPEAYMAAADLLCLPSYREGFSNVIIQAAACGVPAVGSDIYGISDAVEDGKTGLLYPPGQVRGLADSLMRLIGDSGLRAAMASAGMARARRLFARERLTNALAALYRGALNDRGTRARECRPQVRV